MVNLKRNSWLYRCIVLLGMLGLAVMGGCHSKHNASGTKQGGRFTVIVGEAGLYQQPDRLSQKVATLSFGQEVTVLEKKMPTTARGWVKIRTAQGLSGFVKSSILGPPELIEKLHSLMKSVEGVEPQASGVTTSSTNFLSEPGSEGQSIEKLSEGTRFEMFERQATLTPQKVNPVAAKPKDTKGRKDVWYKVKLPDGRVGYIFTRNLKFEPPTELSEYTRNRRTVAWLKLQSLKSENSESINEYLVAYATPGVDFGADYNRVELYTWDGNGYQTSFAQSSLQGILPIHVIHEGNDVFFEIREIENKQPGHLLVRRYHFPRPIKEVARSNVEAAIGLH